MRQLRKYWGLTCTNLKLIPPVLIIFFSHLTSLISVSHHSSTITRSTLCLQFCNHLEVHNMAWSHAHKVKIHPVIHSYSIMLVLCVVSGSINARHLSQLCFSMTEMLDLDIGLSIHCFDLFGPDRTEPSLLYFAKSQSVWVVIN